MQTALFNMAKYQYKVKNRFGELEEYSKEYDTMCEALNWYSQGGKWLEKECNRNLILCEIIDLKWKQKTK